MKIKSKKIVAWLACQSKTFEENTWRELMKSLSIDWNKSKSTDDAPIWHPIEGKGYVIWISRPHLWYHQNQSYWRIIVSANSSITEVGINMMNVLIQAMIERLPGLEPFEFEITAKEG